MIEIARRYLIEVCEEGDLHVLDALVAPYVVLRDPLTPYAQGRTALIERLVRATASFSDISIAIDEIAASVSGAVMIESTWRARHAGAFLGVEATGRRIALPVVDVVRVGNGRIVEHASHYDLYSLLQQLGALPEPDRVAASRRSAPVLRLVPP